ncbi:MAG: ATP-binding cassette domain-containing protein [Puniceicoccales bacterium]|nr:ATP-binding cassette domain-containing protein [Puniceicoccales bacterium]
MLTIENVYKSFQGNMVLKDITLAIEGGSILGLAGPSGEGKSTLLRCIQGLENIDSGKIVCGGRIGFMFQDFQLFPHMSVLQNVVYAGKFQPRERRATLLRRAEELLERLGVWNLCDRYPDRLSGGQKQRVALARTLMLEPEVLLCDEPTSGLDMAATADVAELLRSICAKRTVVAIASHDMSFLTKVADRIVLLRHGTIAADIALDQFPNLPKLAVSFFEE